MFGKRVTVSLVTARGVVTRRVTAGWLAQKQAQGHFRAVYTQDEYVIVHVLDPDRGYSAATWKVGEDIPAADLLRCRESAESDVYIVRAIDAKTKRAFALKRSAWESLRSQPAIPAPTASASPNLFAKGAPLPLGLNIYLRWARLLVSWSALRRGGKAASELANSPPVFSRTTIRFFWTRIFVVGAVIALILSNSSPPWSFSLKGSLSVGLSILNYAGFVALAFAVVASGPRVYSTVRLHRLSLLARAWATTAVYRKSENSRDLSVLWLLLALGATVVGTLGAFFGFGRVAGLSGFVLGTGLGGALLHLPPAVLFLGASAPRSLEELATLRQRSGWRVAALLDSSTAMTTQIGTYMDLDNFRASDHAEWRRLVAQLKNICPLCVVDTAVATEHVLFEAREIFREHRLNDVIFLADPNGGYPVLRRLHEERSLIGEYVFVAASATLDVAVRALLWQRIYGNRFPHLAQVSLTALLKEPEPAASPASRAVIDAKTIQSNPGLLGEIQFSERNRTFREGKDS